MAERAAAEDAVCRVPPGREGVKRWTVSRSTVTSFLVALEMDLAIFEALLGFLVGSVLSVSCLRLGGRGRRLSGVAAGGGGRVAVALEGKPGSPRKSQKEGQQDQ